MSWIISSEETKVSAFSLSPISDLILGRPPGARSSRTAGCVGKQTGGKDEL